jgi:hypothetical protein
MHEHHMAIVGKKLVSKPESAKELDQKISRIVRSNLSSQELAKLDKICSGTEPGATSK